MKELFREILFIRAEEKNHWHPRIMLTSTKLFSELNPAEQKSLQHIHDDFFFRRHEKFWEETGDNRLKGTLKECEMLVCGEDLGMIPDCVPGVMQKHQILSLELQRMPQEYGQLFANPAHYPYRSV